MATVHCLAGLVSLVLAVCTLTATGDQYEVITTGPCTADIKLDGKLDDTIDITPLNHADPTKPAFTIPDKSEGYNFLYNPCTGLKEGDCSNGFQTVCQQSADKQRTFPAGRTNFSDFTWKSVGIVELRYDENPSDPTARHSYFTLECSHDQPDPNIVFLEESPGGHYRFHFNWTGFCKEIPQVPAPNTAGLSGGSIMVIIFFPTVLLYFVVGAVVQKFVRGVEGVEMIPNVSFWTGLPGMIADGARFAVSPCCGGGVASGGSGAYNTIKE